MRFVSFAECNQLAWPSLSSLSTTVNFNDAMRHDAIQACSKRDTRSTSELPSTHTKCTHTHKVNLNTMEKFTFAGWLAVAASSCTNHLNNSIGKRASGCLCAQAHRILSAAMLVAIGIAVAIVAAAAVALSWCTAHSFTQRLAKITHGLMGGYKIHKRKQQQQQRQTMDWTSYVSRLIPVLSSLVLSPSASKSTTTST